MKKGATTKPAAKRKRPRQLAPAHKRKRLKPISLWPLDFDTVMRGLVAIPIGSKAEKRKGRAPN